MVTSLNGRQLSTTLVLYHYKSVVCRLTADNYEAVLKPNHILRALSTTFLLYHYKPVVCRSTADNYDAVLTPDHHLWALSTTPTTTSGVIAYPLPPQVSCLPFNGGQL